jgi:hypothetical protein
MEYALTQACIESPGSPLLHSRLGELRRWLADAAGADETRAAAWRASAADAFGAAIAADPHWIPARIARAEAAIAERRLDDADLELDRAGNSLDQIEGRARRDAGFWRSFVLGFSGASDDVEARAREHRDELLDLLAEDASWRDDVKLAGGVAIPDSFTPESLVRRLRARTELVRVHLGVARARNTDGLAKNRALAAGCDAVLAIDHDFVDAKLERAYVAFLLDDYARCAALVDPYLTVEYPRIALHPLLVYVSAVAHCSLYEQHFRADDYDTARSRLDSLAGGANADADTLRMRAMLNLARAEREGSAAYLELAREDITRIPDDSTAVQSRATLTRRADSLAARLTSQGRS